MNSTTTTFTLVWGGTVVYGLTSPFSLAAGNRYEESLLGRILLFLAVNANVPICQNPNGSAVRVRDDSLLVS